MMKKLFLATAFSALCVTTNAQSIPNGGFENYSIQNYQALDFYGSSNEESFPALGLLSATQTTVAQNGNFALKLETISQGGIPRLGYVINGNPNTLAGGIAVNEVPTSLSGYYKGTLMPNDTALIFMVGKHNGVPVGQYFHKLHTSQTAYTAFNIPFNFSGVVDTVILGFVSHDFRDNSDGVVGTNVYFDNITLNGLASQPFNLNGNFENWHIESYEKVTGWNTNKPTSLKTSNKFLGNWAIKLSNYISDPNNLTEVYNQIASTGIAYNTHPNDMRGGYPYTLLNDSLFFHYIYTANTGDSAAVIVKFKKNGAATDYVFKKLGSVANYTKVKLPITLSTTPDSVIVTFVSQEGLMPVTLASLNNSLYVDEIYFKSQPLTTNSCTSLPNVSIVSTSSVICSGQSTTLTASGASTYQWLPSANTTNSININPASSIIYTVVGTNTLGCSKTATINVTVNALPFINITATDSTICSAQSTTLIANGAPIVLWNGSITSNPFVVTPTVTTTYSVVGTALNGCSNSATFTLNVNALPIITAVSSNSLLCIGGTATLTANGALTYNWSTGANLIGIAVTPTITTNYTVTGTDVNGCINATTVQQNVSLCTGITNLQLNDSQFTIYPNPNNGLFTIEATENAAIVITDAIGRTIISKGLNYGINIVNLTSVENGVYFLNIITENKRQTVKLIKN